MKENDNILYDSMLSIYFHIKMKLENTPELRKFKYHGWMHTKNIYDAVCYLAALERINDKDTKLLKIASLFHDTGYTTGKIENHEYNSVEIARKELPSFNLIGFNLTENDINEVCRLIISTIPEKEYGDILEAIMKDADLEYLGRDYYPYVSELLRLEKGIPLSISWRENQLDFLESHKFITYSARLLFNRQKEININVIKKDIENAKNLGLAEIFIKEPSSLELLFFISDEGPKTIYQISKEIINDTKITDLLDKLRQFNVIEINKDLVDITSHGKNIVIKLRSEKNEENL